MPTFTELTNIDMSAWMYQLLTLSGKGILILGVTALVVYTMRSSSAAMRYLIWCTGVLSLMLLPLFASALPDWEIGLIPNKTQAESYYAAPTWEDVDESWTASSVSPAPAPTPRARVEQSVVASSTPAWYGQLSSLHWTVWLFGIWMTGVLIILARLTTAHIGATMLVRKGELVHNDDWHLLAESIQEKLGIAHIVRLRYSSWTTVPMSVGIFRSYVVLPITADEWDEEQRRTVLIHELAHVKRKDCLLHLLTQVTSALYWLNPLVWVASWQLRIERERACDDIVIQYGVNPSTYAETLLQTARSMRRAEWSTIAAVSMARHSQLEGRLLSILDPLRHRSLGKISTFIALGVAALIAIPLAILTPVQAQEAPREDTVSVRAPMPAEPFEMGMDEPTFPDIDIDIPEIVIPEMNIEIPEIVIPEFGIEVPPIDIVVPEIEIPEFNIDIPEMAFSGESYEGRVNTDSLTVEQIITLRKYGIDADFIRALKEIGYDTVSYRELLTLGRYGADADYIVEMNKAGYGDYSLMDYAHMRKYGVDSDFVAEMKDAGFNNLSAEDMINMSKYGVDEDLVALMVEYGYDDMNVEEIISVSKYGLDEDLIIGLDEAGYSNLSVDELIGMSKYGVDEDLIISLANNGYANLPSRDLINASKYGLDEDLIESLGDAGYTNLSISDLISMSKYGVDEDLVAVLGQYGYKDLSAEALISTSKYGVDEDLIVALYDNGFERVDINELVSMSKYGVDEDMIEEIMATKFDVDVDDLIRLQKYGVDAEYIRSIMEADIKDITLDQLIEMKKHGVDADYLREMRGN